MQTTTAADAVLRTFKPIQQFTRGWMMSKETGEYGTSIGFANGKQFWIVGRAGVLGSCPVDVAVSALAFHGDQHIAEAWGAVPEGLDHLGVSHLYLERIEQWGERVITSTFDEARMNRLDQYGRRIINAAPASLGALFAGWRQMPIPDGFGPRVALTTHVLREMRMGAHLHAITACGLAPVDAILASTNAPPRTGVPYAEAMGFEGPFRDPDEIRDARLEAEDLTNRILEPFFAVLSPEELDDFGELIETTRNAIDM